MVKYDSFIELGNDGTALVHRDVGESRGRHFTVIKDKIEEDGTRVLIMKPRVGVEVLIKETAQAIAKQLESNKVDIIKEILTDALSDVLPYKLQNLHDKIVKGEEPVKLRKGCLEIHVGKGHSFENSVVLRG